MCTVVNVVGGLYGFVMDFVGRALWGEYKCFGFLILLLLSSI
jgi:hypothetical protein